MLSCFCYFFYFRSPLLENIIWEIFLLQECIFLHTNFLHMATPLISYCKFLCICVLCKTAFPIKITYLTLCVYAINKAWYRKQYLSSLLDTVLVQFKRQYFWIFCNKVSFWFGGYGKRGQRRAVSDSRMLRLTSIVFLNVSSLALATYRSVWYLLG